ncbi:hypothetical protein BK659_11510 [Pseudomonas brassicacearum]|uniref:Toxin n=1 Tax=Pseudomonas brassicacearum TaxID=930166 RepID=A0A423H8M5_9PSED|nr:RHS repeat-associated core domain-containing protein [Pseudomonas brassicacearum]RON09541.1 hypothetical protein BK659_11510 [Pseudomonas brassicacearum]
MLDTARTSLDAFTPAVTAVDPRGLAVRVINYHRAQVDTPARARVTRQKYDLHGRLSASIDPRLGSLAESDPAVPDNLSNTFSLSGATLFSNSVDSGWRLSLLAQTGNSVCSWDGRGQFRQQQYDALNRLVAVIENTPDQPAAVVERLHYGASDTEMAAHNQSGRLIRHDDTVGTVFTSGYGLLGSPLEQARRFTKALAVSDWPLDEDSRDTLLEQQQATTCWDFSALGETLRQVDARKNTQRSVYDVAGNLKRAYLQVKGADEKTVIRDITYNVLNRIEREEAGNGVISSFEYDDRDGRLAGLHCADGGQRPLQSLRYEYDPVGNVVAINDEAAEPVYFRNQRVEHRCTYSYDSLYQLIRSTGFEAIRTKGTGDPQALFTPLHDPGQVANYREDYDYDDAGNLRTLVHVGGNHYTRRMFTSVHSNRSLAVYEDEQPGEPEIGDGFDHSGNLRELLRGQVLEWSGRNQLYRVTPVIRPDGQHDSEVYGYDSDGQRLRKTAMRLSKGGVVTQEVRYLPGGLELHTDLINDRTYQVIRVTGGHSHVSIMYWESEPPAGVEHEFWRYSLSDHLESSTVGLSQTGEVLSQERYYPYGGTAWSVDNGSPEAGYKTIRYAGKERDASGLYYYGLRYYAPWLQRWINPDPAANIDGLNFYRFVRNNPVTLNDSNGLSPPIDLIYGFDEVRSRFLPRFGNANPGRSLVTIDLLNNGLSVFGMAAEMDYSGLMKRIGNGIVVDEGRAKEFIDDAHFYRGTIDDAKVMLQSWADYLKDHVSLLNIGGKMERLHAHGKPLDEFLKKNAKRLVPTADVSAMTDLLQKTPDEFSLSVEGLPAAAKTTIAAWFIRQTSKMGIDWFEQTQERGSFIFLDVDLQDPQQRHSGFQELISAALEAKRYKGPAQIGKIFEPITYSERRHLQKKVIDPQSTMAKRTQIVSYAPATAYLK